MCDTRYIGPIVGTTAAGYISAFVRVRDKNGRGVGVSFDLRPFLRVGWGYAGPIGRFARADGTCNTNLHPLNMNLHPLNMNFHPSNIVSHACNFMLHPSKFMLHPLNLVSHPSKFVSHPCNIVSHPLKIVLHPSKFASHRSNIVSNGPSAPGQTRGADFNRCARASWSSDGDARVADTCAVMSERNTVASEHRLEDKSVARILPS
jgi:hypothetical protein